MISDLKFEISNLAPSTAWAADNGSGSPTAPNTPTAPQPPMTDIHDIKPILDMGMDWHWLIWVLAAVSAVAAGLLAWWWWRRRRTKADDGPAEVPLPSAEAEANALLDELSDERAIADKLFYFRLSAVLRRYVERRYAFPAAEMTVEELLPRVAALPLPGELTQPFNDLCRRAEPIKFAGMPGAVPQRDQDLKFVREFVRQTTPVEVPQMDNPGKTTDQSWADRIPGAQSRQGSAGPNI